MIPTIGVMIGFYIITRMLSFLLRKDQRSENTIVKIFAVITILVTIFTMLVLTMPGSLLQWLR